MLLNEKFRIIEISREHPEAVRKIILHNPKFRVEIEIPEKIFEDIGGDNRISIGNEVVFQLTEKETEPEEWDLYAWGIPYMIKEKNGERKIFISIGGLQCIIRSTEKIDLKLMKKIYLMVKL